MRKTFFYTIVLLLFFNSSYSQKNYHFSEQESYKVHINFKDKGYLSNLTDSSLQVSDTKCNFGAGAGNRVYNYYDVEKFSIRTNGSTLRSVLWGSGIGLIMGVLSSFGPVEINDQWDRPINVDRVSTVGGAVTGILTGAIAGLIAGSIKRHFTIGKHRPAFQAAYADLRN
jgi:hypothetical protein